MNWKIDKAKEQFSELITAAEEEPQLIYEHNQLVAAVIEAEMFQEFLSWQQQRHQSSLADSFAQLRQLCIEEDYIFEVPSRQDRPNPFLES
ncbi:MAG: prevent-host-death protein [Symploca sp. SIO3E6]|nr:prevent-host-death protein [Caldora sp. SIO3E6]